MNKQQIAALFAHLEQGDGAAFFAKVAEDVDWTVMGTHPLAGHYHSKQEFLAGTFAKLHKVLPDGTQLSTENILIDGDWAIVELRSMATARDGMRFDNRYCWLCRFSGGTIVEVRAYLDSWLVGELFRRNPIGARGSAVV
ncbi:nuclear transport factor 2 family protein [Rhizobium sp. 768_B6_N1_8]|jgi:ketosteroid isomerase-like protein|uniref:nuclear transport factor 2 family protein n=1 Tax=unclassified Rhizobium TaxID=2613769 RepID=UPI003F239808